MSVIRRGAKAGLLSVCLLLIAGPGSAVSDQMGSQLAGTHFGIAAQLAATTSGLYLWRGPEFAPLDANTLADIPNGQSINIGDSSLGLPRISTSGDGSKILVDSQQNPDVRHPPAMDITVRVFDARSGMERSRFHPPTFFFPNGITNDGKEVFGTTLDTVNAKRMTWYLLDGSTGRLLHEVRLRQWCCVPTLYDPARHRLYAVDFAQLRGMGIVGPRKLTIVAYDVTTGRQVGTLRLTDFAAGSWNSSRTIRGHLVPQQNGPGAALSPDGQQITVLDGSKDVLTTIDTENLTIISSVRLSRPQSLLTSLAVRLGVSPTIAEAKMVQGTDVNIRYSSDGRRLYETGWILSVSNSGEQSRQSIGLRSIDAASGSITGEAFPNLDIGDLAISPDGSAIYALAQATPKGHPEKRVVTLVRMDPSTLEVAAQRTMRPADMAAYMTIVAMARPGISMECGPPSPSEGAATEGVAPRASLWALGVAGNHTGKATKIGWRMTGSGPLRLFAEAADGTRVAPDWGPDLHSPGSTWSGMNPAGDDYGSGFTFPKPGCWRIHATRDNVAGDIWFRVGS